MNYLRSIEYMESKSILQGDYKKAFMTIENYYIQAYTEQSYEVQISLKEILNDFLRAQESDKPLEIITNSDVKKYAINIIEEKLKSKKGLLYWLTAVVGIVWLVLFLMLSKAQLLEAYRGYSFMERMNNIYFTSQLFLTILIIMIISYPLYYIRFIITKILFYRTKLIVIIRFAFSFCIILLVRYLMLYFDSPDYTLRIHIPSSLFLILFFILTAYLIIAFIIFNRKIKAKKLALLEYEEISIEQVDCPSCGHRHDLDYPKCPNCGYRNE